MSGFGQGIITLGLAIIGIAILVVIFNSKNTSSVIKAGAGGFATDISAALGPLGNQGGANLNFTNAT